MSTANDFSGFPPPLLLADHPALDLLNTTMIIKGSKTDLLYNSEQVVQWLGQIGLGPALELPSGDASHLLDNVRKLRDSVETLVDARRENRQADPSTLNEFLRSAVPQLAWDEPGKPALERFHQQDSVTRRLSQLAYSAAELLAEGDFSLVRKCESPDCSLMFYDRTKSHKRRWCSMALCGNRHKAAEFRKRHQAVTQ